ncbi:MAG: hypothetical protein JNK78_01620 [Planctomycetes bacterium]|nr:hypothetical protein [Planctomycetota bacterium]
MRTLTAAVVSSFAPLLLAQEPPRLASEQLPVREITAFKDGHAYVVRETALPPGSTSLVLDELPAPVLGTFWPFATGGATLVSAKAGSETVSEAMVAIDLKQVVKANVGKNAVLGIADKERRERIEGRLLATPARTGDDAAEGDIVLIATATGTRAVPLSAVRDVEVNGEFNSTVATEQKRQRLTLSFAGGGGAATVGVMYVQQGFRWVPSYRVDIDGNGKASVQLEATIVNDLVDLRGATVNLVVGAPRFTFAGLLDPISLQQEMAQVAASASYGLNAQVSNFLSNSIRTQGAAQIAPGPATEPTAGEGAATEDLFVFPVRDVTLKKGERLVLPVASFELSYRDVYTLLVPFSPPLEVQHGLQGQQVVELAKELAAPKAMHVLRLRNGSKAPLTTAPALVLTNGLVLAQGRMRYTPIGAELDLEINAAIDIGVKTSDVEAGRQDDLRRSDGTYGRVDMAGAIELRSSKREKVEVEVRRRVLGLVDDVGQDGQKTQLDLVSAWNETERPTWWGWWSWPNWWFRRNGFGEYRWTVEIAPGTTVKLESKWHYFWQ